MAIIEAQVDLFASPDLVPVDEDEHHGFTDRDRKFTIEVHQAVRSGSTTKDNSGGSEIKKVDEDVGGLNQPDKKPSESYQRYSLKKNAVLRKRRSHARRAARATQQTMRIQFLTHWTHWMNQCVTVWNLGISSTTNLWRL